MAETKLKPKRRPRDPAATREAILEAARTILSKDGPEGLSLSQVAHLAGVNRGTAYQHFETREKLIQATVAWVSDKLFRAVYGDPEAVNESESEFVRSDILTDRLASFAMENPELCQVWLQQVLASPGPATDPFWRQYEGSTARFAKTEAAQEGVDTEVLSVLMLAGAFLWPIWARSHAQTPDERKRLARRFANEVLRMSLFGSLRPEHHPDVVERLKNER